MHIQSIKVVELYDIFNYELVSTGKHFIIYGDNGCGKTTILTSIYNLLSATNYGYGLHKIIFKEFSICFTNGTMICAKRDKTDKYSYTITITDNGKTLLEGIPNEANSVIAKYIKPLNVYIESNIQVLNSFNSFIPGRDCCSKKLDKLQKHFSEYFKNKTIKPHNTFFEIKSLSGEDISTNCLSPAEKQILFLFRNVCFLDADKSNILLIDAEISLNIKWQRMFLKTLFDLIDDNTQVIIATHSIEMIANYKDLICRIYLVEKPPHVC